MSRRSRNSAQHRRQPSSSELPHRLLTVFEVAAIIGCHRRDRETCVSVRPAVAPAIRRAQLALSRGRRRRTGLREARPRPVEIEERPGRMDRPAVVFSEEEPMAVRKICKPKGCRGSPRCEHPWWFDLMHGGRRWRMRVDDFAVARGATETVMSKQTAERVWEPRFLAEIMAGRDPRVAPATQPAAAELTVSGFLDRYFTGYVEAEGLRSRITIRGRLNAAKAVLGELPIVALEKPEHDSTVQGGVPPGTRIATVNRALEHPAGGDQLGPLPGPAAPGELALPPVRRDASGQGKRPTAIAESERTRRSALLDGGARHEQCRASVGRRGDARPHHRRARDVLPAGRDAAHSEPPRGLGAATRSPFRAHTRRTQRTGASRSIRTVASHRF